MNTKPGGGEANKNSSIQTLKYCKNRSTQNQM